MRFAGIGGLCPPRVTNPRGVTQEALRVVPPNHPLNQERAFSWRPAERIDRLQQRGEDLDHDLAGVAKSSGRAAIMRFDWM